MDQFILQQGPSVNIEPNTYKKLTPIAMTLKHIFLRIRQNQSIEVQPTLIGARSFRILKCLLRESSRHYSSLGIGTSETGRHGSWRWHSWNFTHL